MKISRRIYTLTNLNKIIKIKGLKTQGEEYTYIINIKLN